MGAVKNMVRGFIFTGVYIFFTIVLPLMLFTLVFSIKEIEWEQQDQQNITFWLTAFGLLVSGFAFFKYSSPKQSIRKGIFALIQVIINCLYLWSYRFSGAAEITFIIIDYGFFTLNLSQMLLIYMGIYFLTIVLKVYMLLILQLIERKSEKTG